MYDYLCQYDKDQKLWTSAKRHEFYNENVSAGELAYFVMRNTNPSEVMQISDSDGTVMTYGSALTTAIRIAQHFDTIGLTEDDIVSIFAPNTTYVMPVALAAWFNGTPFQPMNTVMETNVCTQIFEKIQPKIIFCDGLHYEKLKKAAAAFKPAIYTICNHVENVPRIEELLEPTKSERNFKPKPLTKGPTQTMIIMLSSGTTGLPKGICLSNRYVISDMAFTYQYDTIFSTSSIDWLTGLVTLLTNVLVGGTRVITSKPYSAEYLHEIITKYKISVLVTNPSAMLELTSLPIYSKECMKSIRMLIMGGSSCPENTLKIIRSSLTNGKLYFGYGSTEMGAIAFNNRDYKLKSVGQILPNLQMKIVDSTTGERLGPNEKGEVCLRKTNDQWLGYYKNPEANKSTIDAEGFVHTGDLGYVDDEHYLYLVDRCRDVMKYWGYKWSPHEIEVLVAEMPEVKEVCAFGVYDNVKLYVPAAAVVVKPGCSLTSKDVVEFMERRSEVHYKHLDAGAFIVNELPRNRNDMADFITIYHQEEKLWKGLDKPKLCNDNISAGAKALEVLRSKNPQDIMQISDSEKTTITYGSALKAAIKIAEYFKSLSLNADDVVGILAPDTTYVMPVALASWFNGTPFQAINCKWETAVVRNLYEFSRPKIIFCDGLQYEKVKAACENFKPLIYTLCNHLENVPQIEDLLQRASGAKPLKYGSKQTMVIMVSSGTSGMPKGVCVPNSTCITDFGFTNDTTKMFSTSSIDWSSGLLTFMANVLVGGTRIITQQPFTAEYLLQLIVKYKINFLSTNPSNLIQASLLKEYTPETMQSVKLIFTAGSYCSELNLERMRSALTKGLLFYGYGGTETGGVAGRLNSNKPKSVGRLLPNVQLKIVDVNNGEHLGPNEIGEICVRHDYEWCGYYNNAKATANTLDSEGFIHTGDLGYMDEDNFLFLTGRCKDIMKYLGFQYSPNDIEEIIAEMEDVVDVCVFGVYDEVEQDVAAAAVVKREGSTLTKQQVIKYVESKTEVQHKRIHYGIFFVKELPRNHNGKLLRDKIKKICLEMERCDKNE
ncbi:hypothetical protein FF38_14204 [Lucilia cuprina]|uniref:Luciferin 4-monooxygenase n=1 Tax=Lucilia cuprina TaxID=7375 RepID=A0A0L0BPT7_LUCCU|nr:hypothetical protein FF38_14204 [Lucilia cuprina]